MTSPFETSGSTKEFTSADDLLRELCGDDEAEAIIRNENEQIATAIEEAEASNAVAGSAGSGAKPEDLVVVVSVANTGVTIGNDIHVLSGSESFDPFESTDEYLTHHRGQFFIFDIETFPDESRFPRPTVTSRERREWDLPKLQSQNAEIIVKDLKTGLMQEDQLAELLQLENTSKKPRSTVAKEIMKAIEDLDSDMKDWQTDGSLDPWKGKIVAFSWSFLGEETVHTLTAQNADEERFILATFWALQSVGTRVGYNIKAFDDQFIVVRSMLLGVEPSCQMETGRYSKQSKDIIQLLFPDMQRAKKCKDVAAMLGIPVPAGDIEGSHVFGLVESGDWDTLSKYSNSDVVVEKAMFKIVKKYLHI
jgi:hypothetical protein